MRILGTMNGLVIPSILLGSVVSCDAMVQRIQSSSDVSPRSLQNPLVNDPWSVFDQCSALKKKFLHELHDQHVFDHQYVHPAQAARTFYELCRRYEAENPIFLLGEPDSVGKPAVREAQKKFEHLIAGAAMKTNLQRASVIYTTVGAKLCFSGVSALSKMLTRYPVSMLTIHSIDNVNTCCTKYKDIQFDSREIFPNEVWCEPNDEQAHELRAEIVNEVTQYFNPQVLDDYVREDILLRLAQKRQIIHWFRSVFPHATTNLFIHQNVESYLSYIAGRRMSLPNVLVSSDSYDHGSVQISKYYPLLVRTALLYNSETPNLLLHYEQDRPMVASYSLEFSGRSMEQGPIMRLHKVPLNP